MHGPFKAISVYLLSLKPQMQFYLLLSFLAIAFGVCGEQLYPEILLKDVHDISGLRERQTGTCDARYFPCSIAEEGGCCPTGTNCTTTICVGPPIMWTGAGQQLCGSNCCISPLVCSESGLTCFNGGSPAPAPAPSPAPTSADPCRTTSGPCNWLNAVDSCSDTDNACFWAVFDSVSSSDISACVSCEQSVNSTVANAIVPVEQECASAAPAPASLF